MTAKLEILNIPYEAQYTLSTSFKTEVDEHWSGKEQRRAAWSLPRRIWELSFQKAPEDQLAFREFFERKKGRYMPFYFLWAEEKGGDGNYYEVRFSEDTLNMQMDHLGFASFKVPIIQVSPYPAEIAEL